MQQWEQDLTRAVRDAKATFDTVSNISNEAHARAAIALLHAFGDDPATLLFAEPRTPYRLAYQNARPADLLVLAPGLGALAVEVKGWSINSISEVEAGNIHRFTQGAVRIANPWHQAQLAAADIQSATRNIVRNRGLLERSCPYFDWVVALPFISRADWQRKGFDVCLQSYELLLQDDLANANELRHHLERYTQVKATRAGYRLPFSREELNHVREALGSSHVIRSRRQRTTSVLKRSRFGNEIEAAEVTGKRLSPQQIELVEREFDGRPQLIRGVAGSGKTVVLVRNCVRLAMRLENRSATLFESARRPRIAIVCFNITLVRYLRDQFQEECRALLGDQPLGVEVDIHHMAGLQRHLANSNVLEYLPHTSGNYADPEHYTACMAELYCQQLDTLARHCPAQLDAALYDAIYVDEGQDFYDEEYRLLMRLLRPQPSTGNKNLVIFYDDAQNLYGRKRPTWIDLGIEIVGRTDVMRQCYRNTLQTVEFAFNVLLGTGADTRVSTRGFADTSTLTQMGLAEELPDRWRVSFAERSGPAPMLGFFANRYQEQTWVLAQLRRLVEDEGVRPDDILMLFATGPGNWKQFQSLQDAILVDLPSIRRIHRPYGMSEESREQKRQPLLQEAALTVTTVASAKGLDAPVVFVLGADLFSTSNQDRASFYVAATRAKMQLLVSGIRDAESLTQEMETVGYRLGHSPKPPEQQSRKTETKHSRAAGSKRLLRLKKGDMVHHAEHGTGVVLADALHVKKKGRRSKDHATVLVYFSETGKVTVSEVNTQLKLIQPAAVSPSQR